MNNTDKTSRSANEETTLPSVDTLSLEHVTGGCGACGQTCASGAAAADGGSRGAAAAFNAFAPR